MTIDALTIILPTFILITTIVIVLKEKKPMMATKIAIYSFLIMIVNMIVQFGLFDENLKITLYDDYLLALSLIILVIGLIIALYKKEISKNMNHILKKVIYLILILIVLSLIEDLIPNNHNILEGFGRIGLPILMVAMFILVTKYYKILFDDNKIILIIFSSIFIMLIYHSFSPESKARRVVEKTLSDYLWEEAKDYGGDDWDKVSKRYRIGKNNCQILNSKLDDKNNIKVYVDCIDIQGYYLINGITFNIMKIVSTKLEEYATLGNIYYDKKDYLKAKYYFSKACNGLNAMGCNGLGLIYAQEQENFKSMKYLKKSCDLNSAIGCNNLAKISYYADSSMYLGSFEIKEKFEKSCDLGYQVGCNNLAVFCTNSRLPTCTSENELFEKSCNRGVTMGCFNLATTSSITTESSKRKVINLYFNACNKGLKIACFQLQNIKLKSGDYRNIISFDTNKNKTHFNEIYSPLSNKSTPFIHECKKCHGENFEKRADGKSRIIKNMSREEIVNTLILYQYADFDYNINSSMRFVTKQLNDKDINALADYISSL